MNQILIYSLIFDQQGFHNFKNCLFEQGNIAWQESRGQTLTREKINHQTSTIQLLASIICNFQLNKYKPSTLSVYIVGHVYKDSQ